MKFAQLIFHHRILQTSQPSRTLTSIGNQPEWRDTLILFCTSRSLLLRGFCNSTFDLVIFRISVQTKEIILIFCAAFSQLVPGIQR